MRVEGFLVEGLVEAGFDARAEVVLDLGFKFRVEVERCVEVKDELFNDVSDDFVLTAGLEVPPGVRYQFDLGSFRHSPTVTPFHPLFLMSVKKYGDNCLTDCSPVSC